MTRLPFLLAALLTMSAPAPLVAQSDVPDPPRVVARLEAHDREIAALRAEIASLKSQRVAAAAPTDDAVYAGVVRRVESGQVVTLCVGVPADGTTTRVGALEDTEPGVYQCYLEAGRPVMARRAVAFATPVRSLIYQLAPRACAGGNCNAR